jgi:Na+/melibiose symporter-like transporter
VHNKASLPQLLRYGILGIPLAFAGLPVYVHVPKFYTDTLGVNLALLGTVLLVIRLLDAFIDPLIGVVSDKLRRWRRTIMVLASPLLLAGYIGLFNPPSWAETNPLLWLVACLGIVYLAFSTLMINYYAMALDVAADYHDNTRAAAFREGSMLVGVLLASILPTVLLQHYDMPEAYSLFSFMLAPLLLIGCMATLIGVPAPRVRTKDSSPISFLQLLSDKPLRWVLFIGFCNAIPTAITSTLFMFFTSDVLKAEEHSGPMLAVYFLSAAAGMPLWSHLSVRYGKKFSLRLAMAVAIACFIWAWGLGGGDITAFYIICVLSGITMGADVTLLPSIMADTLTDKPEGTATAFGLWNLCSKLTMALAAGIALPLLAFGNYQPGAANTPEALAQLSMCYALLPCLFKAIAIVFLHISPLDKRNSA